MKEITTVCARDCYDTCSLKAFVDAKGKIVKILHDSRNPYTTFLCPRGNNDHKRIYLNRILYPYINSNKVEKNTFVKSNWDFILNRISSKLKSTITTYGSESVLFLYYEGNMGLLTRDFPKRIWNCLGATQTDNAICSTSGHTGISLHYGKSYGTNLDGFHNQKVFTFWGFNAAVSSPHIWKKVNEIRNQNGSQIVVIDPRRNRTAEKADLWVQNKPGSDVFLSFGIVKYLIEHKLINFEYISRNVVGYEKYKKEVLKYSYDEIEEATNVEFSLIETLSNLYATNLPNLSLMGIGLQKNDYGADLVRSISLIPSLLGIDRGFYFSNGPAFNVNYNYLSGEIEYKDTGKTVSQVKLSELIHSGEFKFIYIANTNPALTLPNQELFRKGLLRKDVFTVIHDTHWTETAQYANIVLPAATYLEKLDIVIPYSHNYVQLSNKIVEPLEQSKDEIWIMKELAKRLGLEDGSIFEDPVHALSVSMKNSLDNGNFSDLMNGKMLKLAYPQIKEFQTPSGKVELFSSIAEKLGYSSTPKPKKNELEEGQFVLINSATMKYTHTQFQDVFGDIPAYIEINQEDAESNNINNEEEVLLENEFGKILVKVKISKKIQTGVLWSPRQFKSLDGKSLSHLMSSNPQKIGSGPRFNSTLVKIKKI